MFLTRFFGVLNMKTDIRPYHFATYFNVRACV